MEERGKQYDKPDGERSMARTVEAFNAITGHNLSEPDGWLLLQVLKDVRQWQTPGKAHPDSLQDCIAYAALKAEALLQDDQPILIETPAQQQLDGLTMPGVSFDESLEMVEWFGNQRPIPENAIVQFVCKNGMAAVGVAGELQWGKTGSGSDIVSYKVRGWQ